MAGVDGSPQSRAGTHELETSEVGIGSGWAYVSHALRGFYELVDRLDEVLLLEISNFARQLKFSSEIRDDHWIISHLTAGLWFHQQNCGRETIRSNGIPADTRERQVAVPEPKARECYGQDAGECSTSRQAVMGIS